MSRPVIDDGRRWPQRLAPVHRDHPAQDDEDPGASLSGLDQMLARGVAAQRAEASQALQLRRAELGEYLMAAGLEDGGKHRGTLAQSDAAGRPISHRPAKPPLDRR